MSEWWRQFSAEKIVDSIIRDSEWKNAPYPSVRMHIEDEATLKVVRSTILRAEVAGPSLKWDLHDVDTRPYQCHYLSLPNAALQENRELYITLIRRLLALGVVQDIRVTHVF